MRRTLVQFEITLRACLEFRRIDIFPVPPVGRFRQQGRSLAHRPRRPLVETEHQVDIQVRIIRPVDTGHIVRSHRIVNLPVGHPRNQVFHRQRISHQFPDLNPPSEFLIQVLQPFLILSGQYIDLLSQQLRHILQRVFALPLHQYLMRDALLAAVNQTVLPAVGHIQVIGNQVALSPKQGSHHLRRIIHDLQLQFKVHEMRKLLSQFILKAHRLPAVIKVRSRTVQRQHHQLSPLPDFRQIVVRLLRMPSSPTGAQHHHQAEEKRQTDSVHRPTIFSIYIFRISIAFRLCPPCGTIRSAYRLAGSMNSRCIGFSTFT